MKKLKILLIALVGILVVSGSAMAVTPALSPPKIEIPKITVSVPKITFPDGYFAGVVKGIKVVK